MPFGRITKLDVNIDKCQTRITYANKSTRFLISNPSGFVFRSMCSLGIRCCTECANQGIGFLQRHFGPGGSIPKTVSLCDRLAAIGLHDYAQRDPSQSEQAEQANEKPDNVPQQQLPPKLYTCHLELLPKVFPQYAGKMLHPKGRLQVSKIVWHLGNCKWMYVQAEEYELPKCNCLEIKETMDYINEAMKSEFATEEQRSALGMRLLSDSSVNIQGINVLVQKLNELLEEQNRAQDNE